MRPPPKSTLFPYTTLFRSVRRGLRALDRRVRSVHAHLPRCRKRQRVGVSGIEEDVQDRKSTRLNSSHSSISYAVFCLKKKRNTQDIQPLAASCPARLPRPH